MDEQQNFQASEDTFRVRPDLVVSQYEATTARLQKDLVLRESAFEQLKEMYNNQGMQVASLEAELARVRGELEAQESFAVDQQTEINRLREIENMVEAARSQPQVSGHGKSRRPTSSSTTLDQSNREYDDAG